jgi:hypothetical protein
VRGPLVSGLLCLLAACNPGSSSADAGACKVATDCPEIDCQCVGGGNVASYCLCQGGIGASGECGPGAVCAQSSDCSEVCQDVNGPGGNTGGGTTGGGGGGGHLCASQAQCGPLPCACDGGSQTVQTYCLQGQCTCPGC